MRRRETHLFHFGCAPALSKGPFFEELLLLLVLLLLVLVFLLAPPEHPSFLPTSGDEFDILRGNLAKVRGSSPPAVTGGPPSCRARSGDLFKLRAECST